MKKTHIFSGETEFATVALINNNGSSSGKELTVSLVSDDEDIVSVDPAERSTL